MGNFELVRVLTEGTELVAERTMVESVGTMRSGEAAESTEACGFIRVVGGVFVDTTVVSEFSSLVVIISSVFVDATDVSFLTEAKLVSSIE